MTSPATLPGDIKKLGPGVLTIGAVGAALDFSGRCTKATVVPKVNQSNDVPVLSGDTIAGDRDYEATLEATVFQDDLVAGGLVRYSWDHRGEQVPFTFAPYNNGESISGVVTIDPIEIGGDVNKKNTADLKWSCVGFPTIGDDLT